MAVDEKAILTLSKKHCLESFKYFIGKHRT
jgi:hypothetical protein